MYKNRVNEELYNNQGCLMKIIEQYSREFVLIEFQDDYRYKREVGVSNFIAGKVRNPFHKSVYGVGYLGCEKGDINKKYYTIWKGMLRRCYCEKTRHSTKSYIDCTVCENWLCYKNFEKWCVENYYELKNNKNIQLDKDIILNKNKIYSPTTCIFVPSDINKMFVGINNNLCGVGWDIERNKWVSYCNVNGRKIHLGRFDDIVEAKLEYNRFKEKTIKESIENYKQEIPEYVYNIISNYKIKLFLYQTNVNGKIEIHASKDKAKEIMKNTNYNYEIKEVEVIE